MAIRQGDKNVRVLYIPLECGAEEHAFVDADASPFDRRTPVGQGFPLGKCRESAGEEEEEKCFLHEVECSCFVFRIIPPALPA